MFVLVRHLLALCFVFLAGMSAWAQPDGLDYEAWQRLVTRAEESIEANRASDAAMETLRDQLVDWRQIFKEELSRHSISVRTIEAQLETLGPEPESGEPERIAAERAALKSRLDEARAPSLKAELAHSEAEELIRGVDVLLRSRQADAILALGPSPLNPVHWGAALREGANTLHLLWAETVTAWKSARIQGDLTRNLPLVLFYLVVGLLLIFRGRRWVTKAMDTMIRDGMSARRWLVLFGLSLGQVILPFLGVTAVTEAISATDVAGLRGGVLLGAIPDAAFTMLFAFWIGGAIYSERNLAGQALDLPPARLAEGRRLTEATGILLAVEILLLQLARYESWEQSTQSVLFFPIILAAAGISYRISRILRMRAQSVDPDGGGDSAFAQQVLTLMARFLQAVAIIGIGLEVVGYTRASQALLIPAMKTMLLFGFLHILQRLASQVFFAIRGSHADSLAPVVFGFLLSLASIPFLALIWGARVSEVTEVWSKLAAGFQLGEVRITPQGFFIFLAVFAVGLALTRFIQGTLRNTVLPKTRLDQGGQNAVVSGVGYVGITLAALLAINNAGINLGSIALVAGALSVGIGFGLQTIVSNFVSGIILLIERPVSEGDWIEVNGQMGYVRDISVRSTRIETFDRTDVIVPNSELVSGTVTNYTRGNTIGRVIAPVGVAYGTDPRKVEAILLEVAEAHPMVLATPKPYVVFQGFGDNSLDFEIRAILRDVNWVLSVRSDMNYEIARRFAEEGIEVPFPQRDIWLRNAEVLTGDKVVQAAPESTEQPRTTPPRSAGFRDDPDMDGGDGDGGDR